MVHDELIIGQSILTVERALRAAQNSNQAGENAIVAMAAANDMKAAIAGLLASNDEASRRKAQAALAKASGKAVMA